MTNTLIRRKNTTGVIKRNYVTIFSRHPSHNALRKQVIAPRGKHFVFRLGSITEDHKRWGRDYISINSIEGIKNSMDKLRMKNCFSHAKVNSLPFVHLTTEGSQEWCKKNYPFVIKHRYGSRGTGNTLIKDEKELRNWFTGKELSSYIAEQYTSFTKEYRIHCSKKSGIFSSWRKLIKDEVPKEQRWVRNSNTSVFKGEFEKPKCWKQIESQLIKCLENMGLDICGFDVRVNKTMDKFWIIESNTACSLGEIGAKAYINEINKIVNNV